jgi:hypothetical protein
MAEQKQRQTARWVQISGLLLLLVALPLGSFYYLKKGADYRRSALAQFDDYGRMPDLERYDLIAGELPDSLRGNMFVLGWLAATSDEATAIYAESWRKLGNQFLESPYIYFVSLVQDSALAQRVIREHGLAPYAAVQPFLRMPESAFYQTAERIQLPLSEYDAPGTKPIVALVDSSLTVRNFYDLTQEDEVRRLVNHIALFIPLPSEKDILIDRSKEL